MFVCVFVDSSSVIKQNSIPKNSVSSISLNACVQSLVYTLVSRKYLMRAIGVSIIE